MPAKKIYTKEEKIKKETRRLKKIFMYLDKNKAASVQPLINTAAFIIVSLDELQNIINEEGYTQEYQNGANQKGIKQTAELRSHIDMTRNLSGIMKQLVDLAPAEKRVDGKLAMFQRRTLTSY